VTEPSITENNAIHDHLAVVPNFADFKLVDLNANLPLDLLPNNLVSPKEDVMQLVSVDQLLLNQT